MVTHHFLFCALCQALAVACVLFTPGGAVTQPPAGPRLDSDGYLLNLHASVEAAFSGPYSSYGNSDALWEKICKKIPQTQPKFPY
jgi:hypothetical protein